MIINYKFKFRKLQKYNSKYFVNFYLIIKIFMHINILSKI